MLRGPRQAAPRSAREKATARYLNDHLAGATFTADLARRLSDWTVGSSAGERLAPLARELDADRLTIVEIMERLGISRDPARQAGTWLGDKVSRVRLSASGDEPTGLLLALETLMLGVAGNLCLWRTLRDLRRVHPALDAQALDGLATRAQSQRAQLEQERRHAEAAALLDDTIPEGRPGAG